MAEDEGVQASGVGCENGPAFQCERRRFQFVITARAPLLRSRVSRLFRAHARRSDGELIAFPSAVERPLAVTDMVARNARIDRILCAVAFSPSSRHVVASAASLAAPYDGEVHLLHVTAGSDQPAAPDSDPERALKKLFALARSVPGRPRISAAVTAGDAAAEIVRHAWMARADLIAIGMHAHDGSVSPLVTRVALDAPCPVLAVDETTMRREGADAVDRIVVGVNFLPASLAAADYALALAHALGAQVTVVHVLPEHWEGPPHERDGNVLESRRVVEHHFRQLLQIAIREVSGSHHRLSEIVTSGRPCVEIVRVAGASDAALIVMGIDAEQSVERGFGETASCVMQFAGRSVLLVQEGPFRSRRAGRMSRRQLCS